MAVDPKEVAGSRASLPAQQAATDPLQTYCPDLDQWPRSWAYEAGDIPPGLRIVECFKPFLRVLLSRHYRVRLRLSAQGRQRAVALTKPADRSRSGLTIPEAPTLRARGLAT
jgi:hypothetical protein